MKKESSIARFIAIQATVHTYNLNSWRSKNWQWL